MHILRIIKVENCYQPKTGLNDVVGPMSSNAEVAEGNLNKVLGVIIIRGFLKFLII